MKTQAPSSTAAALTATVRSLGYHLNRLVQPKKTALDHIHLAHSEIEFTGQYDPDGIFMWPGRAMDVRRFRP